MQKEEQVLSSCHFGFSSLPENKRCTDTQHYYGHSTQNPPGKEGGASSTKEISTLSEISIMYWFWVPLEMVDCISFMHAYNP